MIFPSSNWQEPRGFIKAVQGCKCAVCGSSHDIGFSTKMENIDLCERHSLMSMPAIKLIQACKEQQRQIEHGEFTDGRWNSYDRDAMIPHMETMTILEQLDYSLKNCSPIRNIACTYEEAVQCYAAELVKRLGTPQT